jgi:hypothetical protein
MERIERRDETYDFEEGVGRHIVQREEKRESGCVCVVEEREEKRRKKQYKQNVGITSQQGKAELLPGTCGMTEYKVRQSETLKAGFSGAFQQCFKLARNGSFQSLKWSNPNRARWSRWDYRERLLGHKVTWVAMLDNE